MLKPLDRPLTDWEEVRFSPEWWIDQETRGNHSPLDCQIEERMVDPVVAECLCGAGMKNRPGVECRRTFLAGCTVGYVNQLTK